MRAIAKVLSGFTMILLFAVITYVAKLVIVGTPQSNNIISFRGFVPLPKGPGILSVLDYALVDGRTIFVTNESSGFVYRVTLHDTDLPAASDVDVFTLSPATPAAHGVAIDPITHLAFVTRSEANTVDVFDPLTLKLVKRISVADDCDTILYDPDSKLIYVASGDSHMASLIDPASQELVGVIPLDAKPEYAAVDRQDKLLYENLRDTNSVAAIDLAKRSIVQRWELSRCEAPTAMAIDETDRRLFIGCAGNAQLKVFDLQRHETVASIDVGGNPDSVVYDPSTRRIFVTGKAGILSVIEQDTPDSYRSVASIQTHYGAHTLAYDPSSRALFVAYAGLLVAPRLAMFTMAPRYPR
jgi:DNA-binding beta-propeller fold protein YncE